MTGTTPLLVRPTLKHVVSVRFTEREIELINEAIEMTGERGSDLIRRGAMEFVRKTIGSKP